MSAPHRTFLAVVLLSATAFASGLSDHGEDLVPREKFDFALDGYFRTRGEWLYNLDLDRGTTPSGKPLYEGTGPIELQSGAYYTLNITADGSAELAVAGPEFFRAIWINEIVVNDIEVRAMAVDSLEFDAAGSARLTFIAIKPGTFDLHVPGSTGETQRVQFAIR